MIQPGDGILGILIAVLPPIFGLSCLLEVEIGQSPDDWYIRNTTVTACVFSRRAREQNPRQCNLRCRFHQILEFGAALARGGGGGSVGIISSLEFCCIPLNVLRDAPDGGVVLASWWLKATWCVIPDFGLACSRVYLKVSAALPSTSEGFLTCYPSQYFVTAPTASRTSQAWSAAPAHSPASLPAVHPVTWIMLPLC